MTGPVRERHRFFWRTLAGLIVLLVTGLPALAASSDCVSDDAVEASTRIAACTRMIEDATEQGIPSAIVQRVLSNTVPPTLHYASWVFRRNSARRMFVC
ncbi:hypothetical protein [Mesorhizobium sp. M0019]|uniref:hypothetical protein n=1 Tax=Mesorhizobium sp. M0019 TaxID=2956845 RepID=UPI003338A2FC